MPVSKRSNLGRREGRLRRFLVDRNIPEDQWRVLRGWTKQRIYQELKGYPEFVTMGTFDDFEQYFWRKQSTCRLAE